MVKNLDFWFLKDLYTLGCPEYNFTIFTKCLSVCVRYTFCDRAGTKNLWTELHEILYLVAS